MGSPGSDVGRLRCYRPMSPKNPSEVCIGSEADIASQFAYAPTFFKRWTVGLPSMNSAIARPSVLKYSVL